MILKASAENGALSLASRVTSLSLRSKPGTGGMSTGDGNSSMTPSSIRCTPLFLKDEPQNIGCTSPAIVRARRPLTISASVSSPSSRYLFISSSLASAAVSTSFSCHSLAVSTRSAGMSMYSNLVPWLASSQMMPFILIRSTTPLNWSSAPIGITTGQGLPFRRVFIWSTTLKKLAPVRSILLTNAMRGTLYLLA